ncbi:alpha/beta hydrolase [Sphingobacterium sp. lm-10]|uniref:alpha/beta hydrolase n=1 Tax=Sphingobacterium sp. lm-10 TaxID=2944904 RepID=UPI0020215FBE|nr:alpha/beta hydrolase [Sphingobacterium sp. lm-10]MCL7989085.1 alpha/beta hydrolase [Sphingobacterium sp. lm-10]
MKKAILSLFTAIILLASCAKEEAVDYYPVDQDLVLRNVKYGEDELQRMDVYLPATRSTDQTNIIVYIHAGDWSSGNKDDISLDDNLVSILKEHFPGYALFNLNHRLAADSGDYTGAATKAEMDILQAMDYIYNQAPVYQISTNTYMAGLESGAQLASLYTLKSAGVSSRVKGCIVISGAFDLMSVFETGNPVIQNSLRTYIGGSPTDHSSLYQSASPIQYVSSASPPFLIIHANNNTKFPIGQAEEFAQSLNTNGVVYEFIKYDSVKDSISAPDTEIVFNKIKKFLQ